VKILAVDTALGACSAAFVQGGRVLAHEHEAMVRGHAEALAPMVERVMRAAGAGFPEVDRIAVTTGPGTFTGQRVGLAFARALALALKRPAVGVTTLDAMEAEALSRIDTATWAIAAADAKRGEIYLGARKHESSLLAPILLPLADAVSRLAPFIDSHGKRVVLSGTAAESLMALMQKAEVDATDSLVRQPDAVWVARLAESETPGAPPKPLYLRPPDAKLPETPL
jgi:tRNA threonylcarbamoyladenosine biosynthesis protein TsaB